MPPVPAELRVQLERRYVLIFSICLAVVLSFPWVYAQIVAPARAAYSGFEYNADDHMVYASWMRQAMSGHLMMDNRFAVETQPSLTINLYFFLLGQLARLTGIAAAAHIARIGLSVLLVNLLYGLIRRLTKDVYTTKLALTLSVVAGGIGFLVWHNFGQSFTRATPLGAVISPLLGGQLPTDVWQPEGFTFPSMLTNSLFVASLCLIVFVFRCVLDSRDSWRPVLPGAIAFGVLMNIHSYDALLIALVLLGFLVATAVQKGITGAWVGRAACIGAGAIPAALWFLHVLQNDPVFQARAATETYSPNFRQLIFGYFVMVVLALWGIARERLGRRTAIGLVGFSILVVGLFALGTQPYEGYFLGYATWGVVMVAGLAVIAALSRDEPVWNLMISWAVLGLLIPYFPALFQRKLTMGLSIPWAILAAVGLAGLGRSFERQARNLITVLGIIVLSGTSIYWILSREKSLISANVSNTTVHPVFLSPNVRDIVAYLDGLQPRRVVVVARPGVPNPASVIVDSEVKTEPDQWQTPYIPDLNPFMTGLAGAYTYAGHWSETPDYTKRRSVASRVFDARLTDEDRKAALKETQADYIIAPVPEAFPELPLADLRSYGTVRIDGPQFRLIEVSK